MGTSKNAVLTQIWIALCVYLLLAFIKFQSTLEKPAANPTIVSLFQYEMILKGMLVSNMK